MPYSCSALYATYREYDYYGGYVYKTCGVYGYDCRDPTAPNDCGTEGPTPSPTTVGYPGCEGYSSWIGDGYCDVSTNTEECAWDGGMKLGGCNKPPVVWMRTHTYETSEIFVEECVAPAFVQYISACLVLVL